MINRRASNSSKEALDHLEKEGRYPEENNYPAQLYETHHKRSSFETVIGAIAKVSKLKQNPQGYCCKRPSFLLIGATVSRFGPEKFLGELS